MKKGAIAGVAIAALILPAMVLLGGGAVVSMVGTCFGQQPAQQQQAQPAQSGAQPSNDQKANAQAIIAEVKREGLPQGAALDALVTALAEDNLHNSPVARDHDSVGLFQQRPSTGWGTVQQIMDPAYATSRFLGALKALPNWQSMAPPAAAQAVQSSGAPQRYQQFVGQAQQIVNELWSGVTAPAQAVSDTQPGQISQVACQPEQQQAGNALQGAALGAMPWPSVNPIPAPGWRQQIPVPPWPPGLPGTRVNPPAITPQCVAGALWAWATAHLADPAFAKPPPLAVPDAAMMAGEAQRLGFQMHSSPQAGDMVVFRAGSFYGSHGHVGLVIGTSNDRYAVVEQNLISTTEDMGAHWGTWDIRSIGWPDSQAAGFIAAPPGRT